MKLVSDRFLKKVIINRSPDSHKGDYGRLLLIGGTYPYGGAIIMAALAAVRSGAGLVTVTTDRENIPALHAHLPEAMAFDLREQERLMEQIRKATVILIGPGLAENSLEKSVLQLVLQLVNKQQILIMDGGAISLFAKQALPFPNFQTIFTPHQKEWESLSGLPIESQDEKSSQKAVDQFPKGTLVVQKRNRTRVFQSGEKDVYQLQVGGPYQATGGMGDTLAGMIAGFAGQFQQVSLFERVTAATYLHSAIADELAKEVYVVLPTELSQQISTWMKNFSQ